MIYSEIKSLALSYADREDAEVSNKLDSFLRIVESRINRFLRVQKMSAIALISTIADQEYYALPPDFNGLRDIEISDSTTSDTKITLKYLNPEQMNNVTEDYTNIYYAIIGNRLQIKPAQENKILEIIYYQKLPELTSTDTENWLSQDFPDAYVFGLMVEISSFVKDMEAGVLWEQRFSDTLKAINLLDTKNRWSGTSLEIRSG